MKRLKRIRKVIRSGTADPIAVDYKSGVRARRDRQGISTGQCQGDCIWGGDIKPGGYFIRLAFRTVYPTEAYHSSCLPEEALPLRRFFNPLPWVAKLCDGEGSDFPLRYFETIEEWEAWMAEHYPTFAKRFSYRNPQGSVFQHGTDYHWCRLTKREISRRHHAKESEVKP